MLTLEQMFNKVNYGLPFITVEEDVSYYFLQDGSTLYIYLEPTNSKLDWIHNFMFKKRPYKDMQIPYRVHRGFLKCWKVIEDLVIERIADPSIQSIITVGYSHGGALAVLCHECCWFHRPDIRKQIYGISFEGPRVYGGFSVKKELQDRWKNFVVFRNRNDIVTHVPPFIFGYTHVGKLVRIEHSGKYGCIKAHYGENIRLALRNYKYNKNWQLLFNDTQA